MGEQQRLLKAVLDQQWPGIPEYSEVNFEDHFVSSLLGAPTQLWRFVLKWVCSSARQEFFKVYSAASRRQQFTRAYVRKALETLDHGFSAFDRNLIHYASLVNDAYDVWYQAWAKAVQVLINSLLNEHCIPFQ